MALLRLPSETLKQIFDEVGSSFFRQDLGRLTVCKQWLEFARPACFQSITLSRETLRMLVSAGDMEKPSTLKNWMEAMEIKLNGYPCCISVRSDPLSSSVLNETPTGGQLQAWTRQLDHDLAQLAILAQQSRRLRVLHIRASHSPPPGPFDSLHDYLSMPTMQSILSVENLKVLVLDLPVNLRPSLGGLEDTCHICPAIGNLLRNLKTLHLRMCSICPDVLKPRNDDEQLLLKEVVVNLSLMENISGVTSATHSKRCGPTGGGFLQLKADMFEQAETLAKRMMSPKTLRILTHGLVHCEMRSLDVLNGKTMLLDGDPQWNEDGKLVEETEPESEFSEDDDPSFFLDD